VDLERLLGDVNRVLTCIESGARVEQYLEIHLVRGRSASP
jgi:hypothetical protein